jgi:hypothetical protein
VVGRSLGELWPNVEVEVVSGPSSGDYKVRGQKVKIGTVVRVHFLGEHDCAINCSPQHEIMARLDQLQAE